MLRPQTQSKVIFLALRSKEQVQGGIYRVPRGCRFGPSLFELFERSIAARPTLTRTQQLTQITFQPPLSNTPLPPRFHVTI